MPLPSSIAGSLEITEKIDCSRNEFLYPHPVIHTSRLPELDASSICRYRPGARLIGHLAERFQCASELLRIHNGAEAALKSILAGVARLPRATLLLPEPGWDYHSALARRFGIKVKPYRYVVQGGRYVLDLADLDRRIDEADKPVLLIVSPSNPLGCRASDGTLQSLARRVAERGYCIVDQAYFGFAGHSNLDWSIGEQLEGMPATILVRTLSKYYGIPGLRVGFTAAHPSVHAEFGIEPDYLGFNVFADEFAVSCLEAHRDFERVAETVIEQRHALATGISLVPGFKAYQSEANFLLVRTPSAAYAPWLARHGVSVRTFTSTLSDCVRITIPPEPYVRRILGATEAFASVNRPQPPTTTIPEQSTPCMHN